MRRLLIWPARIVGASVVLILLVLSGGWLWLRTSLPEIDGERVVAGIGSSITVSRDANGVPYIEAGSANDAYFALGFVHAQDRLAQMELMRRLAAGRLSELVGSSSLGVDRYMRTLGLYRLAEGDLDGLGEDVTAALESYAAGVNTFLANPDGAWPPEFAFLWHEPEPWKPADSLVWGRLMALRLTGNWYSELLRARMSGVLPQERLEELWPIGGDFAPDAERAPPVSVEPASSGPRSSTIMPNEDDGSNAWVISGTRTDSGFPILANDPHLGLTLPNVWYFARIDTPDLTLAGATTPGVPFHVLGRSADLAWGLTTTHGDASDVFVERFEGDRYETPEGTEPFDSRDETIRVRFGDPVSLRVRSTRHGPVVSDVAPDAAHLVSKDEVLSLSHTALLPGDRNAEAIYRVNHARNVEELTAALALFRSPQQNVLFADGDGRIGMQVTGLAPTRRGGNGMMPVPGSTGEFDWNGFLPFAQMPRALDPEAGFIVNANNKPAPVDYPHFLGHDWPEWFRAARIEEVLKRDISATTRTSAGLQLDIRSLGAIASRDLLLDVVGESRTSQRALTMLRGWDGSMSRDLPEPLVYYAWVREAYATIFADELGSVFKPWLRDRPAALELALRERTSWCDDVRTHVREPCGSAVSRALETALAGLEASHGPDMSRWRWGSVHRARFRSTLFGHVPVVRNLFDLLIETDGGSFTVNRGGMDLSDDVRPFEHEHGAGYRAVYDLSDLDRSRMMIAAGQSGNPFSPWYDNLLEPWRDGEYVELVPPGAPAHRLVLVPKESRR